MDFFLEEISVNMEAKFKKYWTDIQGLMGIATIHEPRFKHHMLLHCFEVLHGSNGICCKNEVAKVNGSLSDLMLEYHLEEDEGPSSTQAVTPSVGTSGILSSFSARVTSTNPSAMSFRSELDHYFEDEMVDVHTKGFDIFDWWKVAGTCYPTLRMIARDIFAIPITTVASAFAFSTNSRVLSEHRSQLTSQKLDALMCSQDWIRNKYKGIFLLQFNIYLSFTPS